MSAPLQEPPMILSPQPDAVFRQGETISITYQVGTLPANDAPAKVDVLIQKEGNKYAWEIANGLSTANINDRVLNYSIPLGLIDYEQISQPGTYKLITVQHDGLALPISPGPLPTRQLTGDQKFTVVPLDSHVGSLPPPVPVSVAPSA